MIRAVDQLLIGDIFIEEFIKARQIPVRDNLPKGIDEDIESLQIGIELGLYIIRFFSHDPVVLLRGATLP